MSAETRKSPHITELPSLVPRGVAIIAVVAVVLALWFRPAATERQDDDAPAEPQSFERRAHLAAERLARSPANLDALLTITQVALEQGGEERFELWRDSSSAAAHLAPNLGTSERLFVRTGFLHWYELSEEDRSAVLETTAHLLGDEQGYRDLWQAALGATRSPAFLVEHAPDDPAIRAQLRELTAAWGELGAHRRLRREMEESLRRRLASAEVSELVPQLERLEVSLSNLLLARQLVSELRTRRAGPYQGRLASATDRWSARFPAYFPETDAERVRIQRLEQPAQVQIPALWRTGGADRVVAVEAKPVDGQDTPPMIEAWVDGTLREARAVHESTRFTIHLREADQLLELRVANPRTRNAQPNRVRVSISFAE